jgi:signal transduction histidine kinase/ActR/RegA family two-component response regulator
MIPRLSKRALILAPIGRDADIASSMLAEAAIRSKICRSLPELVWGLAAGAGFALVTEEALHTADQHPLADWIGAQPEWSDFPFVLLTRRQGGIERNPMAIRLLQTLGNVTFLERPFHPTTLVSLARAALRGRNRQYEARASLETLADLNATLEARVAAAIAERKILADIVETTDAFVLVVDPDFRLIAINRACADEFARIFGSRPQVGDFLLDVLAGYPEYQTVIRTLWSRALAGEEFTEVAAVGDPAGGQRHYEMKFGTLCDRDGRRIGAYQFAHDVTQRLQDEEHLAQTETALRQAQKMEAVGQLTGGVAHDFNNLLMAFQSGLRMLERPMDRERRQRIVDSMQQAIERGTALTRQLLAFSRREPLEAQTVDLETRLIGMREILQRSLRGDVHVEMAFEDDMWPIEVDPGELELAILNICVNARDAMPDGGTIRIAARNAGKKVRIAVTDSGLGMPPEVQSHVFEPFYTTKEVGKGSGLGLAQVYAFVTRSRGSATVTSEVGRGTTVVLLFPRSYKPVATYEPKRKPDDDGTVAASNGGPSRHVLLVEDDRTVAELTKEVLESIGHSATHVASADAALGLLASGREIDVVLTDVMMPGGMSGVELAREIRRRRSDMPVVLATGYIEVARGAIAEGFQVLVKPYQPEALARTLASVFETQESA